MIIFNIAIFILLITLAFYLSEKIMWIVYFLFNFRLWHLFFEKSNFEIFNQMSNKMQIFTLVILSFLTYIIIYAIIMKLSFEPLKYIYLVILMIIVFKFYTISEIFFFQDYLKTSELFTTENFKVQMKELFTLDEKTITNLFMGTLDWINNYVKIIVNWVEDVL